MRALAATVLGVLLATPVAAQTSQTDRSPNIGQQLLNGLTGNQDQGGRRAYEQGRADERRQQYNGENRDYDRRNARSYDDRGNYGENGNLDRRGRRYDPAYSNQDYDRSYRDPSDRDDSR